jgi:ABC-type nitrate/sulfonate/bicarbonate transport system permease component
LLIPASLLIVWEMLADLSLLPQLFFPPPSALVRYAWHWIPQGELFHQAGISLRRLACGFVPGAILGIAWGILMGSSRWFSQMSAPWLRFSYATPKLTLLPLLMLFWGPEEPSKLVLIGLATFIMLALHTLDAVRTLSPAYLDLARIYGADQWAMVRRIYIPATLPLIFSGLRLSLGRAWIVALSAELLLPQDGLGGAIWMAGQFLATEKLYLYIISASALGWIQLEALTWLESRLIHWRPEHEIV